MQVTQYGHDTDINSESKKGVVFATGLTSRVSPVMKHLLASEIAGDHSEESEQLRRCNQPLNEATFHRILRRWEESGFL